MEVNLQTHTHNRLKGCEKNISIEHKKKLEIKRDNDNKKKEVPMTKAASAAVRKSNFN